SPAANTSRIAVHPSARVPMNTTSASACSGAGSRRSLTAVITPSVPSEPISRSFTPYPATSLRIHTSTPPISVRATPGQTPAPAARDERHVVGVAPPHDRRHLLRAPRQHDCVRASHDPAAARGVEVVGRARRRFEHVLGAHQATELARDHRGAGTRPRYPDPRS